MDQRNWRVGKDGFLNQTFLQPIEKHPADILCLDRDTLIHWQTREGLFGTPRLFPRVRRIHRASFLVARSRFTSRLLLSNQLLHFRGPGAFALISFHTIQDWIRGFGFLLISDVFARLSV